MSSLLRSTKFVRYFSGAARTLILNSAKTAEATTFNQKSLCAINNVLMREYATSKKTENLEPLLQRLDSEVKRYGRISKKDIDEVLDEIKVKNDITSSQSLLVIRCCGELVPEELPEQRTLLVQKIWSVLTERGIPMDISHYNALLRVYIENEHPFSPAQFLEELENKGLQPNRVTYQRLMWRYCQDGDVDGATKVLEKMRELSMPVSEPVLNALVMGHAFHGDTDGAKAVLETMAGAGLQPTNHTYKLLACGFAKKGDIEGVESIIKTSSEKDAYLTDRDILEIMEHLIVGGHSDKMDSLLPHLQKGFGYNQDVMNLILRLLNKGHEEPAKKVMKTMPKSPNSDDTIFKGAFFVKQLLRLNRPAESVIKLCKELKQENLVPNAFFIATECALQHGHAELAQKLFKELQQDGTEIRQHYYWPLLVLKSKERDEEGLLQLLRDMAKEGLAPTGEALRDYVIPFLLKNDKPQNVIVKLQVANVPAIVSARNVMIEVLEKGNMKEATEIATQFFIRGQFSLLARPLLNAFAKTKDINSLVTILHVASSRLPSQGDIDSSHDDVNEDNNVANEVGRIVKTAVKLLNSPVSCELLLNALYEKGMSISTDYAQQIEQYLDKNLTTEISELLAKLTSSDLEMVPVEPNKKRGQSQQRNSTQLELLIEQIKSREGSSNINRLQKQLLELYVKENNVKKLNSYLDELKSTDFELSAATLAHLFEFYCSNDDIEKAKDCYNQIRLKYPDFMLSVYKSVCMAHALVKVEKFDEAINYLKDNKPTSAMVNDSFLHNSKCWQILNYLAETKDDKKVAEMTEVLLSNKYIEPSNVILGPSIKVHILKEDLEGALKEFENACKKYRSTPWKGELMKTLIMKEDATKLQWVADLSTQIHGEVNILHDLVLAFVECGRLRQARRILETPGMHTRQRRLDDACQRYVNEGQSEHLEGLLEATRELSHIDRSNIFYHLLVTYCNTDDTDKALGLWTVLQEQGEVPSDQFLATLGKHLKSKNIQVPFIIPEAQKTEIKEQQKSTRQSSTANEQLPTSSISANVEKLVQDGKPSQAMDLALKYIQEGKMPRANVMKYTLKNLALEGNVEKIQAFGKYIDENTKRQVTYDDKLTMAIFKRGTGPQHIDNLYEAVKSASNDQELEMALKKFPRSNALASVMDEPELLEKCQQVAELAASRGQTNPANLLWMEFTLIGKEKEANELWDKTLKDSSGIIFRRLLQESFVRKSPEMIHKLIDLLKTNKNTTQGCLGNVYGRLISYYMTVENDTKKAIAVFKDAKASGLSREHLNSKILDKFSASVQESGLKVDV